MNELSKVLKSLLSYNPETGVFTRIGKLGCKGVIGEEVGCYVKSYNTDTYYVVIGLDGSHYQAHRLAWLYMYDELPYHVDHINGIGTDNRLCNLRAATKSQNAMNSRTRSDNTSGIKGVTWESRATFTGYQARIVLNGVNKTKRFSISKFNNSKEQALQAATNWINELRINLHGEFANQG